MKVAVWDTYVDRKDGKVMHFDILVPKEVQEEELIFGYGKMYVKEKPFDTGKLSAKECQFCHIESASDAVIHSIEKSGFHIIEMENCN